MTSSEAQSNFVELEIQADCVESRRTYSVNSEEDTAPLLPDVTFNVNSQHMAAGPSRENQPLLGGSCREERDEINAWPGNDS